ncbi:class I SAM-dependent methyltransferase [Candidatus Woesearchaeota archaeon]|jgi:ubiquinone/menaquinone biosynthesis C-methylase UbiE|nr:class I SAM-dependent methyltransferase [Candidatus Woesearchaeota archaeon]MBT7367639.1 class I SAM-dependent methyltransferase [Candidatus Woesearchaeota archaeon]
MSKYDKYAKRADEFYTPDRVTKYDTQNGLKTGEINKHPRIKYSKKKFSSICNEFKHPIKVLDLGCGEGRYFHQIQNYKQITGIDASKEMIKKAKKIFKKNKKIILKVGNLFDINYKEEFELAYSIGVLAEHSPINLHLLTKIYTALKKEGYFVFTSSIPSRLSLKIRRALGDIVFTFTNVLFRNSSINRKLLNSYMSPKNVKKLIKKTKFKIVDFKRVNKKGSHVDQIYWTLKK